MIMMLTVTKEVVIMNMILIMNLINDVDDVFDSNDEEDDVM